MFVKDFREQNPDVSYTLVWAADAGSFGRKGWSVYGSTECTDRLEIKSVEVRTLAYPEPHEFHVLHCIDPVVIHKDLGDCHD